MRGIIVWQDIFSGLSNTAASKVSPVDPMMVGGQIVISPRARLVAFVVFNVLYLCDDRHFGGSFRCLAARKKFSGDFLAAHSIREGAPTTHIGGIPKKWGSH